MSTSVLAMRIGRRDERKPHATSSGQNGGPPTPRLTPDEREGLIRAWQEIFTAILRAETDSDGRVSLGNRP